jgi:ribonuclease BN (tRNA processing enzyme)
VLRRCFGREGALRRLRELRCVWLSHRHADHHVGLPRLLAMRASLLADASAPPPPIPVFGPFPLRKVLSACNRIEAMHYTWFDEYGLCPESEAGGRNLDFFWRNAQAGSVQAAARQVCEVRYPSCILSR